MNHKEYCKQYYSLHKDDLKAKMKQYYIENKEIMNKYSREYSKTHREECNKRLRLYYRANREKHLQKTKEYYFKHKEQYKRRTFFWRLKHVYGLSKNEYELMLHNQSHTCKICKQVFSDNGCVDHDHTTGLVRGILCHKCNSMLGLAKDNIIILSEAIDYLKRSRGY